MNKKRDERRRFHRINFEGSATLQCSDDSGDCCRIQNISLGGMFVSGYSPQHQTDTCQVSVLHNSASREPHFQASAMVVWGNEEGVGLKFTAMTKDNYMRLLTTLINHAEQPAVVMHGVPKTLPFDIADQ